MTARYSALKAFTGYNSNDFYVLDLLRRYDAPLHYYGVYGLVYDYGNWVNTTTLTNVLHRCVNNGLVLRSHVGSKVLYSITLEGKRILGAFAMELDRIVMPEIRKYGNGFDLE